MLHLWLSSTCEGWIKFLFWGGVTVYGQWKKLTTHPPNYVQNHHFQRRENINFIFLKSECLHLPLTNITGHFRNPKRLFKLSKFSKNRFNPRPPYTPIAAVVFWPTLSHFSTDFLKKRCQTDQGHMLHQIRLSPKVFETSPFFSPSIAHHYYKKTILDNHFQAFL